MLLCLCVSTLRLLVCPQHCQPLVLRVFRAGHFTQSSRETIRISWNRGSSVSVVSRILAGRSGVRLLAGTKNLSLLRNIQTDSETHRASYLTDTESSFGQDRELNLLPPSSFNVKNEWSCTCTPLICLGVDRDNLNFLLFKKGSSCRICHDICYTFRSTSLKASP